MNYGIGIDMGGTRIKAVVMDEKNMIHNKYIWHTEDGETSSEGTMPKWAEIIQIGINDITAEMQKAPSWIGLSAPGLASRDHRLIDVMPAGRLSQLEGFDWNTKLNTPVPIQVLNDGQAALYGEVQIGAAAGAKDVVLYTLGTGVGGAIMSDGKLLHGHIGRAGHIGHSCIDMNGNLDICNAPGSIEFAMGESTVRERTQNYVASTQELCEKVEKNDKVAIAYWETSVKALACSIVSIVNILDPEMIIIGGGIANAGNTLYDYLNPMIDRYEWRPKGHRVKIMTAKLGDLAGAIGICCFARDHAE